jgi:hypothetical protein
MEALSSSVTSDLTRVTRRNIPEDAILHNNSLTIFSAIFKVRPSTRTVGNKKVAGRELCGLYRDLTADGQKVRLLLTSGPFPQMQ